MPVQVYELVRGITTGKTGKMLGAIASGLVDGMLIETNRGELWLVKNIVGALLPFVGVKGGDFIDGFATHSLGNAAMILTISLAKHSRQSSG